MTNYVTLFWPLQAFYNFALVTHSQMLAETHSHADDAASVQGLVYRSSTFPRGPAPPPELHAAAPWMLTSQACTVIARHVTREMVQQVDRLYRESGTFKYAAAGGRRT